MMIEAMAALTAEAREKRPLDPGKVIHLAVKDFNGRRLVLREHEYGMSRSLLEYRPEEGWYHTIAHTVKLFK